jgi:hypothetical protein
LKSDGLRLEDSQVEEAERLFKLATLGLLASARIIQLVDARDGSARPATDVIDGGSLNLPPRSVLRSRARPNGKRILTLRARSPGCPGSSLGLVVWNYYYRPPRPIP